MALIMAITSLVGSVGFVTLMAFGGGLFWQVSIGICAGISSALQLIAWGRIYVGLSMQKALLHIAICCVCGMLLANLIGTIPFLSSTATFIALSVASTTIPIALRQRATSDDVDCDSPSAGKTHTEHRLRKAVRMFSNLLEPMAGIFLFSLLFTTLGDHQVNLFYLSFLLGTMASGVLIIPLLLIKGKTPILTLIYQVALPLLGLVLIVVAVIAPHSVSDLITRNGFMLFYSFASMLFCASVVGYATADEFDVNLILGGAVTTYAAGGLAGTLLAATAGRNDVLTGTFLALTCAYVIALAMRPSILSWMKENRNAHVDVDESETGDVPSLIAFAEKYDLTERETEILELLASDRTSASIARTLFISESTVRGHAHHIYQKLGVTSRAQAIDALRQNSK